jgi:hypothetical protein
MLFGQLRRKRATGRSRRTVSCEVFLCGYSQPGACANEQGSVEPPDTWTLLPVVWEDVEVLTPTSYPIEGPRVNLGL